MQSLSEQRKSEMKELFNHVFGVIPNMSLDFASGETAEVILVAKIREEVFTELEKNIGIFTNEIHGIVNRFHPLNRPDVEIQNLGSEFLATLTFRAGHDGEMIKKSREFLSLVLQSADSQKYQFEFSTSREDKAHFQNCFLALKNFLEPIVHHHLSEDKKTLYLFASRFRLLETRDPFKQPDPDPVDIQRRIESIILSGMQNPFWLSYFGYFLEPSLRKEGFELNWENIFSLVYKSLNLPNMGFDVEKGFLLSKSFLTPQVHQKLHQRLMGPKTNSTCPFLNQKMLFQIRDLIYYWLESGRISTPSEILGSQPGNLIQDWQTYCPNTPLLLEGNVLLKKVGGK